MRLALVALTAALCGCSVGNRDIAKRCDVDERQAQAAFDEVYKLNPYQSRDVGRCTFMRGDGRRNALVLITNNSSSAKSK